MKSTLTLKKMLQIGGLKRQGVISYHTYLSTVSSSKGRIKKISTTMVELFAMPLVAWLLQFRQKTCQHIFCNGWLMALLKELFYEWILAEKKIN